MLWCEIFGILFSCDVRNQSASVYLEKKEVLKDFAKLTRNHLYQGLILRKLQACMLVTWLKKDSGAGVFLWIIRNPFSGNKRNFKDFWKLILCKGIWLTFILYVLMFYFTWYVSLQLSKLCIINDPLTFFFKEYLWRMSSKSKSIANV